MQFMGYHSLSLQQLKKGFNYVHYTGEKVREALEDYRDEMRKHALQQLNMKKQLARKTAADVHHRAILRAVVQRHSPIFLSQMLVPEGV